MFLVKRVLRITGDFLVVFLVTAFILSKVSHSFSYWWIGLITAGIAVLPDIVSLVPGHDHRDSDGDRSQSDNDE